MTIGSDRVLELTGIRRSYDGVSEVLQGADLTVGAGEIVGLIGQNGAGKTTLIKIAMGILKPHRGQVSVFGLDPWEDPVRTRQRIGFVPDGLPAGGGWRVGGFLDLQRALYPTWDADLEDRLRRRLELPNRGKLNQMSKGERADGCCFYVPWSTDPIC